MSEVSQVSAEKQFATSFLQLISLSTNAPADKFYSTDDYHNLESLGPSLPKLKASLPTSKSKDQSVGSLKLNFKSIKPPYKFTAQLNNVPLSHSLYKIKSDLIESVPSLKEVGIAPSNLKFMIKGKVFQDSSVLSSVPNLVDDISFMVMVSPPSSTSKESTPDTTTIPEINELDDIVSVPQLDEGKITISDSTWSKIRSVLSEDLASKEEADRAFTRLQSGWVN